ncbi:hypothetical protein EJ04DRAFT_507148 [Polyplosphaeria fusca]|uniref:Uncharacterized protein n=1 Tax=Polyplosphaeria fusca TaxID=682080 RepID=A0A9P4RD44_9PLEO|nr:hypothetical protein EJ04DRAFT_507148 [Polyplosphaeria fusca]
MLSSGIQASRYTEQENIIGNVMADSEPGEPSMEKQQEEKARIKTVEHDHGNEASQMRDTQEDKNNLHRQQGHATAPPNSPVLGPTVLHPGTASTLANTLTEPANLAFLPDLPPQSYIEDRTSLQNAMKKLEEHKARELDGEQEREKLPGQEPDRHFERLKSEYEKRTGRKWRQLARDKDDGDWMPEITEDEAGFQVEANHEGVDEGDESGIWERDDDDD